MSSWESWRKPNNTEISIIQQKISRELKRMKRNRTIIAVVLVAIVPLMIVYVSTGNVSALRVCGIAMIVGVIACIQMQEMIDNIRYGQFEVLDGKIVKIYKNKARGIISDSKETKVEVLPENEVNLEKRRGMWISTWDVYWLDGRPKIVCEKHVLIVKVKSRVGISRKISTVFIADI